ncbi:MAG: pimeloyl-ACP methyl ester carboxylesterase [Planctomycetota bacterium]|jgi:pimeloyl-ACP methyl ester carboxylesterase
MSSLQISQFCKVLFLAILITACSSNPVTTTRQGQGEALAKLQRSAITEDVPSIYTSQVIRVLDMEEVWESNPEAVHVVLRTDDSGSVSDQDLAMARAEVAYWRAKNSEDKDSAQRLFMESLMAATDRLGSSATKGAVFDPRLRLMTEIYNRALAQVLSLGQELNGHPKNWKTLPGLNGPMEIELVTQEGSWDPASFDSLISAEEIAQEGIPNEYRRYGVGASMVGVKNNREGNQRLDALRPATICSPVTIIFETRDDNKIYVSYLDPRIVKTIAVRNSIELPVASDLTSPMAYFIGTSTAYSRENESMFDPEKFEHMAGLYFNQPYDPNKTPLILTHGLWSSPLTWIWLANEVAGDPYLSQHFQVWFYAYPSGDPLVTNAGKFRRNIMKTRTIVDPNGTDKAWQDVVLVGHSMGGLLSKFMVKNTGNRLWRLRSTISLDEVVASDEDRERITESFVHEKLPFVHRVIFMCTPHRGSGMADGLIGAIGSALISNDPAGEAMLKRIVDANPGIARTDNGLEAEVMNSIDHLSADSPILQELDAIPFPSGLKYHSIIGDEDEAGRVGGSDGVVPYSSSSLPGALSEKIVQSGHSATNDPAAMAEVRRILRLHLEESETGRW